MLLTELPTDIINCLFCFIDPICALSLGSSCRYLREIYCDLDKRSIKNTVNSFNDLERFISCGKRFIKIHYSDDTCVHYKILHFSQHYDCKLYIINYSLIDPFKLNILYFYDEEEIIGKSKITCFTKREIVTIEVYDGSCFMYQIRAIK